VKDIQLYSCLAPRVRYARIDRAPIIDSFIDQEYIFTFVEQGSCEFRLEERLYKVRPGYCVLMRPNLAHGVKTAKTGGIWHGIVAFTLSSGAEMLRACPQVLSLTPTDRKRIVARLELMSREFHQRRKHYAVVLSGLMAEILGLYLRNAANAVGFLHVVSPAWRNIESGISVIHSKYSEDLSVEQIAAEAGLSTTYFCRMFREYTGVSPHHFLNHVRVEKAKAVLSDAKRNCTEAAAVTGFAGVHSFSKVFKRHVGMSPKNWVKKYLSGIQLPVLP